MKARIIYFLRLVVNYFDVIWCLSVSTYFKKMFKMNAKRKYYRYLGTFYFSIRLYCCNFLSLFLKNI
jgi:hypothetical protein